ncbi:hypothetical protein [Bradyrhizobium sp. CCBAU 51627]|uniref:hypothetical protein n=1 Tax=Bradyrhizobium sp. CCBAU 51627 TaxID=1325088 RepID=UPI002304FDBE|nr:hypothetical protein [Bradyrhizobium sp. CCBAU 51627]
MAKIGKKSAMPSESSKPLDKKASNLKPPPDSDDDYEDGDIATPKRDRYGTDDEPL